MHFHSNDDNGYLPGSGNVDYPPIIEALKAIDYSGYVGPEQVRASVGEWLKAIDYSGYVGPEQVRASVGEWLKAIDYSGYVSTEVFDFKPDPRKIAKRSIDFLRNLL